MHATIRRYEGVDLTRTNEVVSNVNETLVPQLRELPGFSGYYLLDAGNGVLSSISLFETSEQAEESANLVAKWITDENFNTAIPNPPKITSGKVVAHSDRLVAVAYSSSVLRATEGPAAPGPLARYLSPGRASLAQELDALPDRLSSVGKRRCLARRQGGKKWQNESWWSGGGRGPAG